MEFTKSLVPVYSMSTVDQPIELYSGEVEIDFGDGPVRQNATVHLEWSPKPGVVFRVSGGLDPQKLMDGLINIKVPNANNLVRTQVWDFEIGGYGDNYRNHASFLAWDTLAIGETSEFAYAILHFVNLKNFHGEFVGTDKGEGNINFGHRMELEGGGWKITIDTVPNADELIKRLFRSGGHAITCTGKVERCDGSSFDYEKLIEVIAILDCFISFVNGDRSSVVLPVAFNSDGVEVWRGWNPCRLISWEGKKNWSHHMPAKWIAEAFPGFMGRWDNSTWQDPIKLAIEWYLQSKRGTIESVLLLMQSALELLCWVTLVEDEKIILGTESFDKLWASDKIRLLLNRYGVKLDIPGLLNELKTESINSKRFQDGPHAITEIRNGIVHPKKAKREAMADKGYLKDQAARLSIWYLEQVLLKMFNYPNDYSAYTLTYPVQDGV